MYDNCGIIYVLKTRLFEIRSYAHFDICQHKNWEGDGKNAMSIQFNVPQQHFSLSKESWQSSKTWKEKGSCPHRCRSDKTHSFSKGSLGSHNMGKLEIGESFYFGGKEIEIQRIISESDWGSGKCFLLNSSGVFTAAFIFLIFLSHSQAACH